MLKKMQLKSAGFVDALRGAAQRFMSSKRGVAGTEFALLFPVMLTMLAGGFELSRAVAASTRTTYLSNALVELASQATTRLTTDELNRIIETAALQDPDIMRYADAKGKTDFWAVPKVTISSIVVAKTNPRCVTRCNYEANMVFSYSPSGESRACGKVNYGSGADDLPTRLSGEGSFVVVDLSVPYETIFKQILPASIRFKRTVYLAPRYVDVVQSEDNCPGF